MNAITKAISATAVAVLFSVTAISTISFAGNSSQSPSSDLLSYVPEKSFDDNRFDQFNFDALSQDYNDEHELNDAWLGVSAYSNDGRYIGYIEDAILDKNGDVIELVIASPKDGIAVQIQAEYAELTEDRINLRITENEFASIVSNGQVVLSMN